MATIKKEIEVARDRAFVWDSVRDVGAIHRRLVRGFVVDCKLEGDTRVVTFANGMVARERIVTVDDRTFRHAWSVQGPPFLHHNASLEVLALDGGRSRLVWIADLLPDEIAETVGGMMGQALDAMKRTLESDFDRAELRS
jgi:hypothetical protein